MGFTKLDSGIIDSSIWEESADVLKLFITFWAKSNSKGEVNATYSALLRTSNLHPESFQQSLDILMSIDKSSKSQTEDGKRIVKTGESNWLIVNYKNYRERTYSDNPESVRKREYRKKDVKRDVSQNVLGHSASASASASEKGEYEGEEKNSVENIFDHWNLKSPIKHRSMSKAMEKCIIDRLKEYDEPTLKETISNYASVVTDDRCWYKYRSRIEEFFRSGAQKPPPYLKFLPEGFTKSNFLPKDARQDDQQPIEVTDTPKYPNPTTLQVSVQEEFPEKYNYDHYPPDGEETVWRRMFDKICRVPKSERPAAVAAVKVELEKRYA